MAPHGRYLHLNLIHILGYQRVNITLCGGQFVSYSIPFMLVTKHICRPVIELTIQIAIFEKHISFAGVKKKNKQHTL